ncbi:response regulator transcription factor [Lacticaseibacillus thailandensis]|uniref:DNA-binding response regulator, OmpR family (Rec-wHTH domains) n=1 Tax=Lacticaseibacillus thailandensis DSM 22698 = JCM 13996 TaxID=1423810 RepID=A0A0R2CAE9_9LACO|nr:response regulator transcription factor [Lacticaseibacillus thailandensis]KRM88066.1 DNA-binding response regulator, OmpR family (Rec-wHTH domains) [Lacticaseibacillus thailandensis DSM 22698 = JCM 13996]
MKRLLIVEDNQDIQALLRAVLEPDYQLTAATNGAQALPLLKQQSFDLMILDLMLPGVSGESILKTLRQTSNLPVLVLTAIRDKEHIAAVLNAGANDYLTKPFDIDELVARVRVQLRTQHTHATQALNVEGIVLDPQTHTVKVDGQLIELSRKEFELLALLMQNPHQVFAKEDIYQAIWHEPYLDAENTLNVHLSHLRSKLNIGKKQYVTSVWGIGVRLV